MVPRKIYFQEKKWWRREIFQRQTSLELVGHEGSSFQISPARKWVSKHNGLVLENVGNRSQKKDKTDVSNLAYEGQTIHYTIF